MNQAGVNIIRRGNTLYAIDESSQPYALNPNTLETIGLCNLGGFKEYPIISWLNHRLQVLRTEQGKRPSDYIF